MAATPAVFEELLIAAVVSSVREKGLWAAAAEPAAIEELLKEASQAAVFEELVKAATAPTMLEWHIGGAGAAYGVGASIWLTKKIVRSGGRILWEVR